MSVTGAAVPLVSILLPTHNRPDFADQALQSALQQDYPNLDIVVSDNSDDDRTQARLAPYVARYPQLRYLRIASCTAMENFNHCYTQARGEYVNFLMDDDLFHPSKISIMMRAMLSHPNVGIVTSARQLINVHRQPMAAPEEMQPLFQIDTVVSGRSMGAHMASKAGNVLGEPTTALFRKAAAGAQFGYYCGRQYFVLSDMATWLSVLSTMDCIYLREPLSYFRIHAEQDQRNQRTQVRGMLEALTLACDVWEHGLFVDHSQPLQREVISQSLARVVALLLPTYDVLRDPIFDHDQISASVARATRLLLR